ncbi:MAG: DUF87 domain-containing protein [Herpetosiphon sp.]|nr:DUF87 domain-containing protein [Herpetosiphon sp.]
MSSDDYPPDPSDLATVPFDMRQCPYLGELYAVTGSYAAIVVHSFHSTAVGGVPRGSLVLARHPTHDTSLMLVLRVLDPMPLPDDDLLTRMRLQSATRVIGDATTAWDDPSILDLHTHQEVALTGIQCRILGTITVDSSHPTIHSDTPSVIAPHGWKIYRLDGAVLSHLLLPLPDPCAVPIGVVRYSTATPPSDDAAYISIAPSAMLGQKTALFGMTRTGKSNTTKILIRALYQWRASHTPRLVGQLIFDLNGEYANDTHDEPQRSLAHLWRSIPHGNPTDCVIYGAYEQPRANQRVTLINFLDEAQLNIGKAMLNDALQDDGAKFIQNFRQVFFESPSSASAGQRTRRARRILVYRTLLVAAGFAPTAELRPTTHGLFGDAIVSALADSTGKNAVQHHTVAHLLRRERLTWSHMATICTALDDFIHDRESGYRAVEAQLLQTSSSHEPWADEDLKKLLAMFRYPNGIRQLGALAIHHTAEINHDYAVAMYADLAAGRCVIVDQSSGDPHVNLVAAERIMDTIFHQQQQTFRRGEPLPDVVVYIDEAHTVLPPRTESDLRNIWVRTAKEGAKYHIGLVYATQEVSSIQRNIVKNTANWFVGHLNNRDEVAEVAKYYDFADFSESLVRVPERGFVRLKLRDIPFVIPVQIDAYQGDADAVSA